MEVKHLPVRSGIAYSTADESNVPNTTNGAKALVYVCTGQDD